MINLDLTNIPFIDNSFDSIICNHVLEHIQDDKIAIKELFRVLKPNGWAIIQVPIEPNREKTLEDTSAISPTEREKIFGQSDHVRRYGHDFRERLEQAGFEFNEILCAKEIPEKLVIKYSLIKHEKFYFCFKSKTSN